MHNPLSWVADHMVKVVGFLGTLAALGFSSIDAFLTYALGLLYLLSLGAMNFVFLLLPDHSAQ